MSSQDKAVQWFRKQMLIHQSSEKAKNAYKQIQQASLRQYTIEKYGMPPAGPGVAPGADPAWSPPGLAAVPSGNQSNFSDDVTHSFRRAHPHPQAASTPLQPSSRGSGGGSSHRRAASPSFTPPRRPSPASSPLRLEAMRPLPHGSEEAAAAGPSAGGGRGGRGDSSSSNNNNGLGRALRDTRLMQVRSKTLVAQLDSARAAQVRAENETLKGVVRDLARDHQADQAALVDTVVNGALVTQEARFVKKQNRSLAEANRTMYDKAVHAEREASALRDELADAQMQLKVCQKLYDTEQKNSLQSFSEVGKLKKELSKASAAAMQAHVDHMERLRALEGELAKEAAARRTAESAAGELKAEAARARAQQRRTADELAAGKAAEKETSLEIAAQLSEVVQTERLLQEQNRQVMDMLQDELAQEEAVARRQEDQLAAAADQLESYETALQDRLRASMDLEEEFHEKILQHKFYLEEVKQQKTAMQLRLTESAQAEVEHEVTALRTHGEAMRAADRAEAAEQRDRMRHALEEQHAAAVQALRAEHKTATGRLSDDHALAMERLRLRLDDEQQAAATAAQQDAAAGARDEVDALRVYPRKLALEHAEKLDQVAQEHAQRLREQRAAFEQELDIERARARQQRDEAQRAAEREQEELTAEWRGRVQDLRAGRDAGDEQHRAEVARKVRAEANAVRDALGLEAAAARQRLDRELAEQQNANAALRAQVLSQKSEISSLALHAASKSRTLESAWQAADSVFSEHRGVLQALEHSESGKLQDLEQRAAAELSTLKQQLLTAEADLRARYQQELVERGNAARMAHLRERNTLVQAHEAEKHGLFTELHDARLAAVKQAAAVRVRAQEEAAAAQQQAQRLVAAQREKDAVVKRALENQVSALRERQRQLAAQVERLLQIT